MKLKDVTFNDKQWGLQYFSFGNNRFYIFDKEGYELVGGMKNLSGTMDLKVLETFTSNYAGCMVGFNVLHIKLDFTIPDHILGESLRNKYFRFGMKDRRN